MHINPSKKERHAIDTHIQPLGDESILLYSSIEEMQTHFWIETIDFTLTFQMWSKEAG